MLLLCQNKLNFFFQYVVNKCTEPLNDGHIIELIVGEKLLLNFVPASLSLGVVLHVSILSMTRRVLLLLYIWPFIAQLPPLMLRDGKF
jgi:hypothetical protein